MSIICAYFVAYTTYCCIAEKNCNGASTSGQTRSKSKSRSSRRRKSLLPTSAARC